MGPPTVPDNAALVENSTVIFKIRDAACEWRVERVAPPIAFARRR